MARIFCASASSLFATGATGLATGATGLATPLGSALPRLRSIWLGSARVLTGVTSRLPRAPDESWVEVGSGPSAGRSERPKIFRGRSGAKT